VLDDSPIISHVETVSVNDFDAVSVEIEYCSVEMTGFRATSGRCSVRTTTGSQCRGVEIPDSCCASSGESNVCGAGFYAKRLLVAVYLKITCGTHPGVAWQRKKSASWTPKPIWLPDSPM
jgi:hypothetical protein